MALFYTVPQSHCVVIERFGKFSRVQREGLRFKLPVIEEIRRVDSWGAEINKQGYLIELAEQQTDTPTRQTHTRDNVAVNSNASLYWRIVDPRKALYEIDSLPRAVSDIALNALESEGEGRILSSPKIATQNNERAEIEQGVRIPVVNTTAGAR